MIGPVIDFVEEFIKDKSFPDVLEVGSRNVNGSIKTTMLTRCHRYTGLDLIAGEDVDIVADGMDIPKHFKPETFDCVICVETLEHVQDPVQIVKNMREVLKPGGWMLITTPHIHHPEHGWPSDYYRFFENTYRDVFFFGFEDCVFKTLSWTDNMQYPDAVMGYGKKP